MQVCKLPLFSDHWDLEFLSFSFQGIRGLGILPGARFGKIHEAICDCNRGATALPELSNPQGYEIDRHPKAPFS
jgi:hypothetical protein